MVHVNTPTKTNNNTGADIFVGSFFFCQFNITIFPIFNTRISRRVHTHVEHLLPAKLAALWQENIQGGNKLKEKRKQSGSVAVVLGHHKLPERLNEPRPLELQRKKQYFSKGFSLQGYFNHKDEERYITCL